MNILSKIFIVSKYTFKEIMKSRILYGTGVLGIALVTLTFVATEFTYGVPEKVSLDFGLGMLSLSSLGIALFMGVTLLSKEIDSRTVYMVISRPVPRWAFILGKLVGLFGVLILNVCILSVVTLVCSYLLGGRLDQTIIMTILFNILESLLLMLVVVLFSLFANTILSTLISLALLLLGHAIQETQVISFVKNRPGLGKILEIYHLVLPGFYKLNLKDFVVYKQALPTSYLINSFMYGASYSVFVLLLILFIFQKKNLD
jgi:ABC-2 type transport system permease protein